MKLYADDIILFSATNPAVEKAKHDAVNGAYDILLALSPENFVLEKVNNGESNYCNMMLRTKYCNMRLKF